MFEFLTTAHDPNTGISHHMSNLFVGGKNKLKFTIDRSLYGFKT